MALSNKMKRIVTRIISSYLARTLLILLFLKDIYFYDGRDVIAPCVQYREACTVSLAHATLISRGRNLDFYFK